MRIIEPFVVIALILIPIAILLGVMDLFMETGNEACERFNGQRLHGEADCLVNSTAYYLMYVDGEYTLFTLTGEQK